MRNYFGSVIEVLQRIDEPGPAGIDPQGLCPHYFDCQSAKGLLPMDFCSVYKCNTFYYLRKQKESNEDGTVKSGIGRIVEQHLHGTSSGNGNGKSKRTNPIAVGFS